MQMGEDEDQVSIVTVCHGGEEAQQVEEWRVGQGLLKAWR